MRTCPHCGYDQTPDEMLMCSLCGEVFPDARKIGRASGAAASEKPLPHGAPPPAMAAVGVSGGSAQAGSGSGGLAARRDFAEDIRLNKQKTAVLLVLFVLLLIGIGWAVGYWFGFEEEGMIGALVLGLVMGVGAWYGGASAILGIAGAREADPDRDLKLINVVDEMRLAAGLPMPKVYVIESGEANAFATGRDPEHASVAVTRGLLNTLNREELQAVVGHEMSHVRNFDIRYMMLVAALVGSVVLLADIMRRTWWIGGGRRRGGGRSDSGGGYVQLALMVLALLLIILAPLFAMLLQMSISRNREFLADAGSVELTRNPHALASALKKIDMHAFDTTVDKLEAGLGPDEKRTANRAMQHLYIINPVKNIGEYTSSLFATHPPIFKRIERLEAMA